MMPLTQRGDSGFTLAGFLILAALGASLWKGAPLESVRPTGGTAVGYERQFSQEVPARLWQDPFKAVYTHELAIISVQKPIIFVKSPKEVISQLVVSDAEVDSNAEINLDIVGIMLSPGSYPELEERRRRRRYAVLSGLSEESLVPRNPETLNVFYLPRELEKSTGESEKAVTCYEDDSTVKHKSFQELKSNCFFIPFEWFDHEQSDGSLSNSNKVLVLWLDESQFAKKPLDRTIELLKALLQDSERSSSVKVTFNLLGPARSDALRNLVNTDEKTVKYWLCNESNLAEFNIFSPTATVADDDLVTDRAEIFQAQHVTQTPLEELNARVKCDHQSQNAPATNFLRVIRSDDELIEQIAWELTENRNIDPNKDIVVVISEWDTYFGRALPRAFRRHFCKKSQDCDDKKLLEYSYLRGMDGAIPGESSTSPLEQESQVIEGAISPTIDIKNMRRPVGTGQFDYLRRLANEIRRLDRQSQFSDGSRVRVVALLGSDVYDKLLILRALKPELPGAIFATTDLDAQFLHPSEFSWARGLLIATTYDLRTAGESKMYTMPFRDSYQTSVYLATRLIFNSGYRDAVGVLSPDSELIVDNNKLSAQKRMYKKIPPLMFEVGRQDLVPLRKSGAEFSGLWNAGEIASHSESIAIGVLAIALLGIFAIHQLRPMAGRVVFVSMGMVLVFSILSLIMFLNSKQGAGEPIDFLSGATIWPGVYIRVFATLLSLIFMWMVIDALKRSWQELGARFFRIDSPENPEGITISALVRQTSDRVKAYIAGGQKLKATQALPVFIIAILMMLMQLVRSLDKPVDEELLILIVAFIVLITFWWATIYGKIWKSVHVLSINRLSEVCPSSGDAVEMWRNYGEYGTAENRFFRTTGYVLVYFAFSSILFSIMGAPSTPCRGIFACKLGGMTLGLSVMLMLIILFLVVDAARLCICWVDTMKDQKLDWSRTRLDDFVQTLKLPVKHAEAWMVVHLIGERTAAVTRLIYYPVMIILLLLLARSTYFDAWDFPPALAIVIGVNFIIALGSIVRLNHIAKSVRDDIIRDLQQEVLAGDKPASVEYEATPSEREELVKQLANLRVGAYLRVWDQPAVRATLMLLGGAALTYAEYLQVLVT